MLNSSLLNGVMLNAYPDSIGDTLKDAITVLQKPEFKNAFSFFYILPTFFNSDLDRGFSIIDYNLNEALVSKSDLKALEVLNIQLKCDIVLNHLSVASPQFKDVLEHGEKSKYKDFFINWNHFWEGEGQIGNDGVIHPKSKHLKKLFMRKAGLPVLKVPFPDGTLQPYWNTFYQQIQYHKLAVEDLKEIKELTEFDALTVTRIINTAIINKIDLAELDLGDYNAFKSKILKLVYKKCSFLGQMDVNANSQLVWQYYEETLKKISDYGCKILRLDAFAYLHKAIGASNFFNTPGTWQYLERIQQIAIKNDLILLPEIHAEFGLGLHDAVAQKGYTIYDFFLPGLMIHTIENASNEALLKWINICIKKGYKTVNMLGCHDGIPVLDLKGKTVNGNYYSGLLDDEAIEAVMNCILQRGGRVKNLYDPSGKKISYYQVNATFFSALGEHEKKLLLARAIQLFMPGIPQIWYLDLFAGKNDYVAADSAASGGHKEINRTSLSLKNIEAALQSEIVIKQLELIRLRNTSAAFLGTLELNQTSNHIIDIKWSYNTSIAHLKADLQTFKFSILQSESGVETLSVF